MLQVAVSQTVNWTLCVFECKYPQESRGNGALLQGDYQSALAGVSSSSSACSGLIAFKRVESAGKDAGLDWD